MGDLVKWTGSKKPLAQEIIGYFPTNFQIYYEPCIGGGAILFRLKPRKAIAGDIDPNLINLYNEFKYNPKCLVQDYTYFWNHFQGNISYYYEMRDQFNADPTPSKFYFLLRTCFNGLVRYSKKGKFNSPPHHTRIGMHPAIVWKKYLKCQKILKNTDFRLCDYQELCAEMTSGDFAFFDPPYVESAESAMYIKKINMKQFFPSLDDLTQRNVNWALTYGRSQVMANYVKKISLTPEFGFYQKIRDKPTDDVVEYLYLNYQRPILMQSILF
jgi:DNA adenine methylase